MYVFTLYLSRDMVHVTYPVVVGVHSINSAECPLLNPSDVPCTDILSLSPSESYIRTPIPFYNRTQFHVLSEEEGLPSFTLMLDAKTVSWHLYLYLIYNIST